jgi:transitional endoplasmic reticulum ATPase
MYLKKIPKDFCIDYDELAKLTENFVASDIKSIVETIARNCRKDRGRISMEMLIEKIKNTVPSVNSDLIAKHEEIRKVFESGGIEPKKERPRIGFL